MYIVRDIMYLKFGHYKDAKVLLDEAIKLNMFPETKSRRILTDFTGDSYRLILEAGFDTLAEYEGSFNSGMQNADWKNWYERFKPLVNTSHREILKQIL